MPTTLPRVFVTLSPSADALVSRMARLQRSSKSQIIRDLVEMAEPALQRAAALMEAAEDAPERLLAELGGSLMRSQERAEEQLAGMLYRIESSTADLVTEAEKVAGRRPPVRRSTAVLRDPPASNRGVNSPNKNNRKRPVLPMKTKK